MSQRKQRSARKQQPTTLPPPGARFTGLQPSRALMLPLTFTLLLLGFTLLPAVGEHSRLRWSFLGAGAALLAWNAVLLATARGSGRTLDVEVSVRKQHYLQACAQSSVYLYWGWYWQEVFDSAYLIAAQLVFAYALDALLTWSRRDTHVVGFGPFPIILSTNLFLWFKPDWFYLQFLMVAVGFAAKELIRWTKNGRQTHIFNPSSFPLAVFSIVLILTNTTHLTWGPEIALTQLNPPHIYLLIFLVSLPGQFLFGVAAMTLAAVATTYTFGLLYFAATGTYFFLEPSIPIAVFLGMHLLFTDPSTSPRTELGRLIFGILYGLSVVALFALLGRAGLPTFYDKLLAVPILNLMIQWIDRAAQSNLLKWVDPVALGRSLTPRRRNVAYMAVWAAVYLTMQAVTGAEVTLARADVLLSQGRTQEAIEHYRDLVRTEPDHFAGHNKLGVALMRVGRAEEGLVALQRAVELRPDDADARTNLASALIQTGRPAEAVSLLQRTLELRPDYPEARYNLANAYAATNQPGDAVEQLREALRLRPDWPVAMGMLAWLQATHPAAGMGEPEEAVRLASRAAELSGRSDASILDALAASYAAAGRFEEATRTAEEAEALASRSAPQLATDIRARLNLYRAGRPLVTPQR